MTLVTALRQSLQKSPFHLSPTDLEWVYGVFDQLSAPQKLAQLFNVLLTDTTEAGLRAVADRGVGAYTYPLSTAREKIAAASRFLTEHSPIPPLFSADLEGGAIQMNALTPFTNQLGMAASGAPELYERAVAAVAGEAVELGINWAFAPVLDINAEFRSAIAATRSYGSDTSIIRSLSHIHVATMQSHGVAATAKHWPGEGYDARDQHLVTTINPLSLEQWRSSFGELYRALISEGLLTVMSAHIAFPAYARAHGARGAEAFRPASVSKLLNQQLLREELGFNGLIVSDASSMGGLTSWGPRSETLPQVIEQGCDMILFSKDLDSDLRTLTRALNAGELTLARVDEAVLRVLALKATLRRQPATESAQASKKPPRRGVAASSTANSIGEAIAAASPTLVKDVRGLLPLSPKSHQRVVLLTEPNRLGFDDLPPPSLIIDQLLQDEGFRVRHYEAASPPTRDDTDLVIYLLAQESLLTKSHIYMDWVAMLGPMENAMQRTWYDIPTLLLSFGQPYYLYDAPRMPCVINAYSALESVQRAVVRKLLGQEPFTGISPIDPFCGLDDARY